MVAATQQCGKCKHSIHSHDTGGRCSYCQMVGSGACANLSLADALKASLVRH